jgi:hypothetical protein
MKTVKQVLVGKGYTVHRIGPEAPVFEALQKMADEDVGHSWWSNTTRLQGSSPRGTTRGR